MGDFSFSFVFVQLAPWMAAEIPHLVTAGVLTDKVKGAAAADDQKSEAAAE
jgi:hypothetical protein